MPAPKAEPVTPVAAEKLGAPLTGNGTPPIVIELFSSQACMFCPQADRLFSDLIKQRNVIGLACHVDYFDVQKGSLAKPFCTARQTDYAEKMESGPNYTPQMIVNGKIDVVGYKMDDVKLALQAATIEPIEPLYIVKQGDHYLARVTPPAAQESGDIGKAAHEAISKWNRLNLHLWLAVFDRPQDVTIASGVNRGKNVTYDHIVSAMQDLGPWKDLPNGTDDAAQSGGEIEKIVRVDMGTKEKAAGFALLLTDAKTDAIVAAGQFMLPVAQKEPPQTAPKEVVAPASEQEPSSAAMSAPSESAGTIKLESAGQQ